MKSVLTHFYNEEYLLPRWLEHHKKMFDFGVLIDYASTDNSVAICKEICPHWQVIPSRNHYFDARECDREIEFYEVQLPGWRIALTTTEFLVGDINKLTVDTKARMQWYIPGIRFTGWDPETVFDDRPLWEQHTVGISYQTDPMAHQCRSLHNFNDLKYESGRHFLPHNTEDMLIFHYAHVIKGNPMLKRRMQIQHKVLPSDKAEKLGTHHYVDENGMDLQRLYDLHHTWLAIGETDCSDLIAKVVRS